MGRMRISQDDEEHQALLNETVILPAYAQQLRHNLLRRLVSHMTPEEREDFMARSSRRLKRVLEGKEFILDRRNYRLSREELFLAHTYTRQIHEQDDDDDEEEENDQEEEEGEEEEEYDEE